MILVYEPEPVSCDVCEKPIIGDAHTPHDPGCPGQDCACDNRAHPDCCWRPGCVDLFVTVPNGDTTPGTT